MPKVKKTGSLKLSEAGRALIAKGKKKKRPRVSIGGVMPKRGVWVFSPKRKKVAGLISSVRRTGELVVINSMGYRYDVDPDSIVDAGYIYSVDPPKMDDLWCFIPLKPHHSIPDLSTFADKYLPSLVLPPGNNSPRKPKAPKPTANCLCGCGKETKSRFCPGHDMRLRSAVTKAFKEGINFELLDKQKEYALSAHWCTPEMASWIDGA